MSDKDFRVTLRLRNNHLLSRREASGLTQAEFAKAAGVRLAVYAGLETMRTRPVRALPFDRCVVDGCGRPVAFPTPRAACERHATTDPDELARMRTEKSHTRALTWSKAARAVADFLECAPENLWPEEILNARRTGVEFSADARDLMAIAEGVTGAPPPGLPDASVERRELRDAVRAVLGTIPPRYEKIVRMRFGIDADEHTCEEIAEQMDVSPGRINQISQKALRLIQHPSRSKMLRPFGPR